MTAEAKAIAHDALAELQRHRVDLKRISDLLQTLGEELDGRGSTPAQSSAAEHGFVVLPGDNRSAATRYLDDVRALAHMADITFGLIERGLSYSRGDVYDGGVVLRFSDSWIDEIHFAVGDLVDRARALDAQRKVFEPDDEADE